MLLTYFSHFSNYLTRNADLAVSILPEKSPRYHTSNIKMDSVSGVMIPILKIKQQWHYSDVIMDVMASQITTLTSVYSTVYTDADQRKHQRSMSLAFVLGGNSLVTGEFPAQMASNRENVSIWLRHHVYCMVHLMVGLCASLWSTSLSLGQLLVSLKNMCRSMIRGNSSSVPVIDNVGTCFPLNKATEYCCCLCVKYLLQRQRG